MINAITCFIVVFLRTDLADACNICVYADSCLSTEVEQLRNFLSQMVPSYEPVDGWKSGGGSLDHIRKRPIRRSEEVRQVKSKTMLICILIKHVKSERKSLNSYIVIIESDNKWSHNLYLLSCYIGLA